jgi:hypothetical protein
MKIFAPARTRQRDGWPTPLFLTTWSSDAREFLQRWGSACKKLRAPRRIKMPAIQDYPDSDHLSLSEIGSPRLRREALAFAEGLAQTRVRSGLVILHDLFDRAIDGHSIHALFSLLCDAFTKLQGESNACLHPPLEPVRRDTGFPVHADLWRPEMLLHIYDDVAVDRGGASTFLCFEDFVDALSSCASMPGAARARAIGELTGVHREFAYQRFYNLLYARRHAWHAELGTAINKRLLRLHLGRGDGYILHDRSWLHGRDPVRGAVSRWRMHRLVFTQSRRVRAQIRGADGVSARAS